MKVVLQGNGARAFSRVFAVRLAGAARRALEKEMKRRRSSAGLVLGEALQAHLLSRAPTPAATTAGAPEGAR